MAKVLCIPDVHAPYTDLTALTAIYAHIESEKPDVIIQLGDALDMYAFSKFPRTHNLMTPRQELEQGLGLIEEMWKLINRVSPESKKYQLIGNHEERLPKRILERLPEAETLFSLKDAMSFDNVETVTESELEIEGVLYLHGFLTKPYAHMRYFLKPCVFGHTHHAWILFEKIHKGTLFEMTSGYLGDDTQIPLQYTASKINKWTKGLSKVTDKIPAFIPL